MPAEQKQDPALLPADLDFARVYQGDDQSAGILSGAGGEIDSDEIPASGQPSIPGGRNPDGGFEHSIQHIGNKAPRGQPAALPEQDRGRKADGALIQSDPHPVAIQLHHVPAGEDSEVTRRATLGIGQVQKLQDIQDGDIAVTVDGDQWQPDPSLLMENKQLIGRNGRLVEAGGFKGDEQPNQKASHPPRYQAGEWTLAGAALADRPIRGRVPPGDAVTAPLLGR